MLAIVSHDAGGAEILSSWIKQQNIQYSLVVDGPAKRIFKKKIGNIKTHHMEQAVSSADWVLLGTRSQSELEYDAIKLARLYKKKTVSFLDHWKNYLQRFTRQGSLILPDKIWVGDKFALSIAKKIFLSVQIELKENPYFLDLKEELEELNKNKKYNIRESYILYVCTPIEEYALLEYGNENYLGCTEKDAIRYFMNNLPALRSKNKRIIFRPHPSEEYGKYNWVKKEYDSHIEIGGEESLLEEIFNAEIVVGCNSMAMVVGLMAKKRVINGLPPGTIPHTLPMPKIEHLQDLICNE
jgi:hypothetical protein